MTAPLRPQNARKYCDFHEQSGHTTTECRELKKALQELADKEQIDRFLKRDHGCSEENTDLLHPRHEIRNAQVVATIAGGYRKE